MKTVFLFSGQGAQYPGMMADIASARTEAAEVFSNTDIQMGFPLSELIFNGSAEALNKTENTQPALLCCELAIFSVLAAEGIGCDAMVGFSLGEWSALTASGVIDYERALSIVRQRALFMQEAVPIGRGAMAVVLKKTTDEVKELCMRVGGVSPSNYNCPGQISVAGTAQGIERLLEIAAQEKIIAKKLPISVPSHCELMRSAADRLAAVLRSADFHDAPVPLVMNCSASPETCGKKLKENMVLQLTQPVRFEESVRFLLSQGADTFVEIGPGKTLISFVKKIAKSVDTEVVVLGTDNAEMLEETVYTLRGGVNV